MKKRTFFAIIMLLAVSGLILTTTTSFKKTPQKYIGLQLYSLRDSIMKNVPGTIAKVSQMGYKFVEPANYNNGKFYGMDPVAFKDLCKSQQTDNAEFTCGKKCPGCSQ